MWASISLVAFALWLYLYFRDAAPRKKEHTELVGGHAGRQKIWKSKTAVALMFFFGFQSMQAYIQFGWAPVAYRAGGLDATSAGIMISIIALGGIPGGLLMPWLVSRGRGLQSLITVFGALLAIGYLGIAFLPTTLPWLWALCLSVSGFCFPTAPDSRTWSDKRWRLAHRGRNARSCTPRSVTFGVCQDHEGVAGMMQLRTVRAVPWEEGLWTHVPEDVRSSPLGLTITATEMSDAWNSTDPAKTVHTENALVTDLHQGQAVEVAFIADMTEQFDQAGIFIVSDDATWAKAGMELSDGLLQLTATLTRGLSDRSMCQVADWNGRPVRVRAAWKHEMMWIYASVDGEPLQLVRMFPFEGALKVKAGPYVASPRRKRLSITFTEWLITEADDAGIDD